MRKKHILAVSAVAAAFAVTIGFAIQGYSRAARYQRLLGNSYLHAYYELTTAVSQLDASLQKAQYASTPVMLEVLCTDIYGKATAAQMALGELPDSGVTLEQTSAFLVRTGEYARALAKSAAVQGGCSQEERATLQALAQAADALSSSLLSLESQAAEDTAALLRAEQSLARTSGDGEADLGGTAFQSIEADFPETPTLIYDGPFSEHLGGQTPLALDGLPQAGQEEARAKAAEFLGLEPEALTLTDEGGGVLPVWGFSSGDADGNLYIEVTQQGCQVFSLFSSRTVTNAALSTQEAADLADRFLAAQGFDSMVQSYHVNQGNVLTVNYFPVEDNVLLYPDLVKVSVALDTGEIVGFECHGWIMNHTQRDLPAPAVDQAAAQAVVSPDLEVLSHRLALIPTDGEYEVLCYEFQCRAADDSHVIVYVNAATGNEEKILLLVEDETGTLVW
jgi:germination protein YpeB